MKKIISILIMVAVMATSGVITTGGLLTAYAADYTFRAESNDDFYRSTLYEDAYGSAYNYGGQNVTDFYDPLALPGLVSPTPQTASANSGVIADPSITYGIYDQNAPADNSSNFTSYTTPIETAFTPASELKRSDGSIGTLVIPSLSINMKAYEGETSASMAKGVGHFSETSGWNGTIGLCGHNRSSAYTIGTIKNLKIGDTIRYTTVLGTRTYSVSFVGTISAYDWSYLTATTDNRIVLITCLADQPSLRVCVIATESK